MRLKKYAKELGISYMTAWRWFHEGKIKGAYQAGPRVIVVPDPPKQTSLYNGPKRACVYARVSSSQNKKNLETQAQRLVDYCQAQGWQVVRVVKEAGSGISDARVRLHEVIKSINDYDVIVVEHKDRLTRIGFKWFDAFAPDKFHVVNLAQEETEDLTQDLVSIITSFCARLYGQRRGKRKTEKIIAELTAKE